METGFSYVAEDLYDLDERATSFFHGCAHQRRSASFYVVTARDADGELLEGSASYRLRVPPDVPARQYWAVTAYDLATCSFLVDSPRQSIDSYANLAANDDGSVDLYFAAEQPTSNESNWLYVTRGQPFHLAFRFYGPEPAARDGTWSLNDLEKISDPP
jgi:hypothetical protein